MRNINEDPSTNVVGEKIIPFVKNKSTFPRILNYLIEATKLFNDSNFISSGVF